MRARSWIFDDKRQPWRFLWLLLNCKSPQPDFPKKPQTIFQTTTIIIIIITCRKKLKNLYDHQHKNQLKIDILWSSAIPLNICQFYDDRINCVGIRRRRRSYLSRATTSVRRSGPKYSWHTRILIAKSYFSQKKS